MSYIVVKLTGHYDVDPVRSFIMKAACELDQIYEFGFRWWNFPLDLFVRKQHLWVCYRDQEPVGYMAASLSGNSLDLQHKILKQESLYGKPGTRAAYYLMKEFIDFGKANANSIITCVGKHTNIKAKSLERLGFTELETLYKLEV